MGFLFGVELNDERFLNRHRQVFTYGKSLDYSFEVIFFQLNPLGNSPAHYGFQRFTDGGHFPTFLPDFHIIPNFDQVRGDINLASVDEKVVVPDKVPPLVAGIYKPHAINNIIKPPFQGDQHVGSRDALFLGRSVEEDAELLFGQPVHSLHFLLFTKLNSVIGHFTTPALGTIPWRISPPIKGALVRVASVAFEK